MLKPEEVAVAETLLLLEQPELCTLYSHYFQEELGVQMHVYDYNYGGYSARNFEHKINYLLFLLESNDDTTP